MWENVEIISILWFVLHYATAPNNSSPFKVIEACFYQLERRKYFKIEKGDPPPSKLKLIKTCVAFLKLHSRFHSLFLPISHQKVQSIQFLLLGTKTNIGLTKMNETLQGVTILAKMTVRFHRKVAENSKTLKLIIRVFNFKNVNSLDCKNA